MLIGEMILRVLSRKPGTDDYSQEYKQTTVSELSLLRIEFPQFSMLVKGKRIVDFGCGEGKQSVALVNEEDCSVCGIDSNPQTLQKAKKLALNSVFDTSKLTFIETVEKNDLGRFDVLISQNSMEHFSDPVAVLSQMISLLQRGGTMLITFGPPWYAPYGSHMHFFCRLPWLNIIFSEKSVMSARSLYRSDGAKLYEEVESGLNKMTVAKFERIVSHCGLEIRYKKYSCVKGLNFLGRFPLLRELFIIRISCILAMPTNAN